MEEEDVPVGVPPSDDDGGFEVRSPEKEGSRPPLPALFGKSIDYIGNKNLLMELNQLKTEDFDSLNYNEKIDRYMTIVNHMDTAIRNDADYIGMIMAKIRDTVSKPQIQNYDWSDDLWFNIYLRYDPLFTAAGRMLSLKDWQIRYLGRLSWPP
jgi:hypothetical protein